MLSDVFQQQPVGAHQCVVLCHQFAFVVLPVLRRLPLTCLHREVQLQVGVADEELASNASISLAVLLPFALAIPRCGTLDLAHAQSYREEILIALALTWR